VQGGSAPLSGWPELRFFLALGTQFLPIGSLLSDLLTAGFANFVTQIDKLWIFNRDAVGIACSRDADPQASMDFNSAQPCKLF